jgi:hypothetical protein
MFPRIVIRFLVLGFFCSAPLFGQQKPAATVPSGVQEFPMIMRQNVTAGKTPVGTEVQAKLVVGTLGDGTVFPKNAIFSGKVIESVAKTSTEPSRLAIRMDSVQWKDGSAAVKIYLTAWIYPTTVASGQDLQYGPTQSGAATWNGEGAYPDPNSRVVKPFPGGDSKNSPDAVPNTTAAVISRRRIPMKDVMSGKHDDGAVVIASTHSDIKLDKLTTYVFAADELRASK